MTTTSFAVNTLFDSCTERIATLLSEPEGFNTNRLPGALVEKIIKHLCQKEKLTCTPLLSCAASSLTCLDLRGGVPGEDIGYAVEKIVEVSSRLCELYVPNCRISISTLQLLSSKHSNSLKVVDFSSCKFNSKSIQYLFRKCSLLEDVNLSGSTIEDNAFSLIIPEYRLPDRNPLKKRKREIECYSDLDEFIFKRRKTGNMIAVNSGVLPGTRMKHLKISGCNLSSKAFALIAKSFPFLQSLDCSHIEKEIDINPILIGCGSIKSLNINGCKIVQDKKFAPESNLCLSEIHFSGTGELNSNFVSLLYRCAPTLQHVRLRNKSFILECIDFTAWLSECKLLKTLDIYGMPLSKTFIPEFTKSNETIESLDITHCYPIPSEHINILLSTKFPKLVSLTLNQTSLVKVLPSIVQNCRKLSHLCINLDMKGLLEEGEILMYIEGMKSLNNLELWGCKSLSLNTVKQIMKSCPNLKSLLLSTADQTVNAPSLSKTEFKQLTKEYPNVQFKIWNHSIEGNRHFRYHNGGKKQKFSKINTLEVKLQVIQKQIVPIVLVDNIPIWSNEPSASLGHLRETTEGGGALPLISQWCCECDIHNYNGVLYYHDKNNVYWETHEPGIKQRFKFSKEQYTNAINDARLQHVQFLWQQSMGAGRMNSIYFS